MATPTISRDGQYRIDVRIAFRVNLDDLAGWLASSLRNIEMEHLPNLTIKQIRDRVRDEMERRGTDGLETWSDRFGYDETNARLNLAARQIRRAYPDLSVGDTKATEENTEGNEQPNGLRYVVRPVRLGFAVIDTMTGEAEARMGSRYAANDMADRLNARTSD